MKAVILAGGRGERLRPVTDYVPKPLIPLDNIPILEWQVRYLKNFGIKNIVICTGYKTEMIENFLSAKNNFNIKITISKEKQALGTGGAIKQAAKLIKDDNSFVVINGDTITNINLKNLLKKKNVIAAIELRTKFGILETENDKIKRFHEKKEIFDLWMNAGIYHLSKEILNELPKIGDIEKTIFPKYAEKGLLHTVKFKKIKWYSVDSFKDMEECSKQVKKIIK